MGLPVLLVGVVLYVQSQHCFRHFIIPAVEKRIGRQISFSHLRFRLLRGAEIERLWVGPAPGEQKPLVQAERLSFEWRPAALLKWRLELRSLAAEALHIAIVEKSKRLRSASRAESENKRNQSGRQRRTWRFVVEKVDVTGSSIEWLCLRPDRKDVASRYSIRDLRIKGAQLGLGRPAMLDLTGHVEATDPSEGVDLRDGRITFNVASTALTATAPTMIFGQWSLDSLKGKFHGLAAEDLRATGSLEIEQSDAGRITIKRTEAIVSYQKRRGAEIALSGAFDSTTGDGNLRLDIKQINSAFLNLLSTPDQPLDFGDTTITGHLFVQSFERRNRIAVENDLRLANLSVVGQKAVSTPTPLTQVHLRSKAIYERPLERVGLDRLDLSVLQQERNVIAASLTRPISFSLQSDRPFATESAADLTLRVDRLDLTQLNPFLPQKKLAIESGNLTADTALSVASAGDSVVARGLIDLGRIRIASVGSRSDEADISAAYELTFEKGGFSVKQLNADVRLGGRYAGHIEGSGAINPDSRKGEIVLKGDSIDLSALQLFLASLPGVRFRAGRLSFNQAVAFAGSDRPFRFTGQFDASDLHFELPHRPSAQFARWTVHGTNAASFDPDKRLADVTSFSLLADEKGVGVARATAVGQVDLRRLSALANLSLSETSLPGLSSVLRRFGVAAPDNVRLREGTMSAAAQVKLGERASDIALKGDLRTRGMRLTIGDGKTTASEQRDLEAAYDLAIPSSDGEKRLAISDLLVRVVHGQGDAGSLRAKGQVNLTETVGELSLQFQRFDAAPLLPLVGPFLNNWRPTRGILDGQENIAIGLRDGERILSFSGRLRADSVHVFAPDSKTSIALPRIELDNKVTILRSGQAIQADRLVLATFQKGRRTGSLDVTGRLDLSRQDATLKIVADDFEIEPILSSLVTLGASLPILSGKLTCNQALDVALADKKIAAKGTIRADSVRFRPELEGAQIAPATIEANNDLSLTPDKTDVRSLRLSTYDSRGQIVDQLRLAAKGGGLASKKRMDISLNATAFHLDPYIAIVEASRTQASPTKKSKPPTPAKQIAKPDKRSTFPPIAASLEIGKFYYDRLYLEKVAGRVDLTSQGVAIRPLTAVVADGPASATGWLRTDLPVAAYRASLSGENISVEKLLALVSPRSQKNLSGRGKTQFTFEGRGFDKQRLRQHLRGEGSFQVANGEFKDVPILHALASVTTIKELADIRFFQFDGKCKVENGIIHVAEANVTGPLEKLRARGDIGFDERIDLTFDLWLGGELAKRLGNNRILRYLKRESDRFLRLPIPIGMGGSLGSPRPTLNLPLEAILDIGIEQGLKFLRDRGSERKK